MLELYQLYQQMFMQMNKTFVDPWFDNPVAQWYLDQSIDIALKMYYLPFFAATWEDKIRETINSYSICKI